MAVALESPALVEAEVVLVVVAEPPLEVESQPGVEAAALLQPARPLEALGPAPEASDSAGWGPWPDSGR